MAANQSPPPTYAPVILYDEHAKDIRELLASTKFNPLWLKWFLDLTAQVSTSGGVFVPYTGAVNDVNLGAHNLSANNVTATALLQGLRAALTGTGGAGYMDFPAQSSNPAAPAAGTLRFHSATTQGFTRFEQDNEAPTNLVLGRDNVFIAKNTSGGNFGAMVPVYASGATGNVPNIAAAKADSLTTLPAIGLTLDPINNNNFGQVMRLGIIASVNTNSFAVGDTLYVDASSAGTLTKTRPASPNYPQPMAVVLVKGVGNGAVFVMTAPFVGGRESGTDAATWLAAGEVATVAWTDYSATSTVTGWSAFTTKQIFYKQVGKLVFVFFYIDGTSNSTVAQFTVATAAAAAPTAFTNSVSVVMDNGALLTTPGRVDLVASATTVNCYKDSAATLFTNAGQKIVAGQFVYEIA